MEVKKVSKGKRRLLEGCGIAMINHGASRSAESILTLTLISVMSRAFVREGYKLFTT